MLDITRDKPIKVAVRVAVPVRDHPKVQFSIKSCYLMCSHIYTHQEKICLLFFLLIYFRFFFLSFIYIAEEFSACDPRLKRCSRENLLYLQRFHKISID